jgi:hypothetical protein
MFNFTLIQSAQLASFCAAVDDLVIWKEPIMLRIGTKVLLVVSMAGFAASGLVGCGSGGAAATEPEHVSAPIPPDSIFAKVKIGMDKNEVIATIGPPTTEGMYQTGKAWIPYHFGGDNMRATAHYKGVGSITYSSNSAFTSGMSVMSIDYDPTDPGFEKSN